MWNIIGITKTGKKMILDVYDSYLECVAALPIYKEGYPNLTVDIVFIGGFNHEKN